MDFDATICTCFDAAASNVLNFIYKFSKQDATTCAISQNPKEICCSHALDMPFFFHLNLRS